MRTYETPRLIPAHAGKTRSQPAAAPGPRAHPRSRGENPNGRVKIGTSAGSSPLTRGKHRDQDRAHRPRRLIPAHAGKTGSWSRPHHCSPAHPRSRGENASVRAAISALSGSSPLTRGKLKVFRFIGTPHRLIPAHAGKTPHVSQPARGAPAHPRSRGENTRRRRDGHDLAGSSPLTRGKHVPAYTKAAATRLIPAHAGKTAFSAAHATFAAAHPRSRGENHDSQGSTGYASGSSPLTRGKLAARQLSGGGCRLIPAHAGKTRSATSTARRPSAHPRSRGENSAYVPRARL